MGGLVAYSWFYGVRMKNGYRVVLRGASPFECSGRLERVEEAFLLRLLMLPREFIAMQMQIAGGEPVEVIALGADGMPALPAHIRIMKGRPNGPVYDVACLLVGPDPL